MNPPASFLSDNPTRHLPESVSPSVICRRILGNYLEQQGFIENDGNGGDEILYVRFDLFLKVTFEEPRPDYQPGVILEFGERPCDEGGHLAKTPAWHTLPKGHPQRRSGYWIFQTDEELETVLLEIRSKLTTASQKHLWLSQDALEETIGGKKRN